MRVKIHRPVLAALFRPFAAGARLLSRRTALRVGKLLGSLAARLVRRDRARAQRQLMKAFPDRGPGWSRRASEEIFEHLGQNLLELLSLSSRKDEVETAVACEGWERLEEAHAGGRGVILLGAHLGSWEMLGAYVARRLGRVHVVGRRIYYPPFNDMIVSLRRTFGVETAYHDEPPRRILRLLKDGKILGILADQDVRRLDGVFVDFFGRPARTPVAPAALALASGAPLVPIFITRRGSRHLVRVEEPVSVPREGEKRERVVELTRAWSAAVERAIRRAPEQWVWFHRRWRTKP